MSSPTTTTLSSLPSPPPPAPPRHDRLFWINFSFLCGVLALAEAARGIVIPTLSLYVSSLGGSSFYLSVIVAAFSIGRLSSSVVFGYVSDMFPLPTILLASMLLSVVGHLFFILPPYVPSFSLYLLLLARLLTGFATGTLSLARAFTSSHTTASERTKFMSWLGIVQFAGYAFTPILGGIQVNWQITSTWVVDTYTAGTYVCLLLDLVLVVGLYFGMRGEEKDRVDELTPPLLTPHAELKVDVQDEDEEGSEVGQGQRKGGYSAVVETELVVTPSSTEGDKKEEEKRPATSPSPDRPIDSHTLIELVVRDQERREEKQQPIERYISLPTTPTGFTVSAPHRSHSVATPTSRPFPITDPPPINRRGSAPAILTYRPITREDLSITSLVSLSDRHEPPSLTSASWRSSPLFTPVLFICLNATCRGCLAVAETYGSTLFYTTQYGPGYDPTTVSTVGAAWFYTILGGVGVIVFVMMDWFTHWLTEMTLLCWGFIAMCLGFISCLDFDHDLSLTNLSFSMAMIYCIATPITQTLVASMLSKSLPPHQQGKWMGLLTAAGSIGRIVFPLLAGVLYGVSSTSVALMLPAVLTMVAVFALGVGMRVWEQWWTWVKGVEGRAEVKVGEWWEKRKEDKGRVEEDDNDEEEDDGWLTIDEMMERMQRRAHSKHRRMTQKRRRQPRIEEEDEDDEGDEPLRELAEDSSSRVDIELAPAVQ